MKVAPKITRRFENQREQLQQHAARTAPATDLPTLASVKSLDGPGLEPSRDATIELPIEASSPRLPEASESRPWFKRWYVWAALGVVVTTATVSTVMATRDGESRPFNPENDLCGGNCDAVVGSPLF